MRIVALVHTLVLPLDKGHMLQHCVQQLQQKQCLQSGRTGTGHVALRQCQVSAACSRLPHMRHAGGRREERAPRRAELWKPLPPAGAAGSLQSESRKCQLSVTSSFCETTTFQPRSRQAEVGVGRLGRRLAPRALQGSGHATHHGQALVALSRVTCSVSRTQKRARRHDWFTATRLARAPTDSGLPVHSSRLPQ